MNGLHGLTLLKSHNFVIATVHGLKILIPYIFHAFFQYFRFSLCPCKAGNDLPAGHCTRHARFKPYILL